MEHRFKKSGSGIDLQLLREFIGGCFKYILHNPYTTAGQDERFYNFFPKRNACLHQEIVEYLGEDSVK